MIKVIGYLSFILMFLILGTNALDVYPLPTALILIILGVILYVTNEKGVFDD